METNSEKIVNRIKNLLSRADDQHGTPEGELAAAIAAKMMREHAIQMEDLQEKEKIIQITQEIGRSNWLRNLLNHVSNFCSCRCWIHSGRPMMSIAGYESDMEIAHYLFDLIKLQIENAAAQYVRNHPIGGKKISNDFKMSAVAGVAAKLSAIKAQDKGSDPTGTALVLSRGREVSQWVNERNKLREGHSPGYSHNQSGFEVGKNVRLSNGIAGIGPAPRQLKG